MIIALDVSDKSEEANMIRRTYSNIRNKKIENTATTDEQVDGMMATGGVSQVPTEEPIPQEAPNGPPSGVIGSQNASPEETVADDIPMEVPEGAFIINAAAAEVAGYGDIKKMILDAVGVARRLGVEISTGEDEAGDEEAVDLLVSKGEVYIEPTLAKIIGYDVLEKINNRGKREVARRQQEAEAKQQPPQEQPPQAPPQPQMAQEGGFVKKKFADGGEIPLESEQDLFNFMLKQQREVPQKEVNPISDDALALADLEFEVDIVNRSKNDPVLRAAFQDAQGRMPSEYIEMRNMSIREAEQILASQERPSFYDVERVNRAKREGYKTLDSPSFDFKGQYSQTIKGFGPDRDTILTRAHSEQTDPTDVSATLYHELLHKGHQKLVGIPTTSFTRDKTGTLKYVLTTPEQADRARLLHLDVHRRTYEAYKDELSSEALKLFTAQVFDTYGSRATQPYMQKFIKNLISSEAPEVNPREIFKFNMLKKDLIPDDKARPIADAVFAEVAKLPPIRALDEELKTAYQKQRKNSQGFAEGGKTSTEYPDYIKKYFMPEIDYHLETIRTKTVARNQYGQPVTALTSGVLRGDKMYEIPTYDRKGGILSRKQVESSLDSYIEKYGDFGIPQDQYRSLMKEKETYKQNLYKKDSRFQVTDDSITQTVTLPEKGQKNSQGFIPKK